MGGDDPDRREDEEEVVGQRRRPFTPAEIFRLILSTYRASLPYLLVFIAGLLLAAWILTELVF